MRTEQKQLFWVGSLDLFGNLSYYAQYLQTRKGTL